MSAFTESGFLKKLSDINSSQQCIQTLSLWLIHHRKHHESIVKTWLRELENVPEPRKLTFMFLANDVIQNSKKKGPEYGKEFAKHLSKAFSHIGKTCKSERLIGSLGRILCIWEERGVYDAKLIEEFRTRLNNDHKDSSTGNSGSSSLASEKTEKRRHEKDEKKRKHHDESKKESSSSRRKHEEKSSEPAKRTRQSPHNTEQQNVSLSPENGTGNELSPYVPLGDPPEPEELIKALLSIENSASSDAVVRERIANLPPEISEMSCLSKIEDKEAAKALTKQVNAAVELLNDYNARLAAEMEERAKLAVMLRDFQAEQKELLAQAEKSLEEHKKKLNKISAVQKEIRDHLSNLPDMTQLPDVIGELAPLPSAGDLFNIH